MTDLKFAILGFLYHSPNHENEIVALYNQRLGRVEDVRMALNDMMKSNEEPFIIRPVGKNTYKLTSHGNIAYESEKRRRDDDAKQAAEKAAEQRAQAAQIEKDKKQQFYRDIIIAILSTVVGSLVTLLIEHFQEITNAISSLFS